MATMTLDRAKEVADCPDDRCAPECNDALRVLRRALRDAEAQVAFLNAKLAKARAALRQVRVVIDVATYDPVAAEACSSAMRTIDAVLNESDVLRIPPCHPASNTPATNLNVAAPPVENPGPVGPPPFDARKAIEVAIAILDSGTRTGDLSLTGRGMRQVFQEMLAAGSAE